jgi:YVTN family beta-propeller protein
MKNLLMLAATFLLMAGGAPAAGVHYHLTATIPLDGPGGWDYLTVDAAAKRLYVSHATKIVVIDTVTEKVIGEITNTPGVHGIALAPELNRGLVTCGRENKAALVDLATLQTLTKVETGMNPDSMLYEPGRQEFYTINGHGSSATVIDAKTGKVVATIPLDGRPEFCAADAQAGLVFINLEDKSEVAVIEAKTHAVKNRWPVAPGEEPSGMAFDEKNHRLFLGCGNQKMVMLDSTTGKLLASVPIGDGVDANAFDPGTGLAFASCGEGTVTIAKEDGDKLMLVQTLPTEKSARTMALDPATHKIYLAAAKFEAPAAGQRHGKIVPGTLKILVFAPETK